MSYTDEPDAPPPVNRKIIRKFREQIHALGAVWIILGGLAEGLVVVAQFVMKDAPRDIPLDSPFWLFVAAVGLGWFMLGVCTCLKQMWAVYGGLILSYMSFAGQLMNLNICAGIIVLLVILQAHRVIGWARQMREAGVPLDARP
ncbi:MAG TPA: hypothetical protein VD866_17490 [Urbifossiella sp.]|nr:hypothetical protein [Urbifossiella sp.]